MSRCYSWWLDFCTSYGHCAASLTSTKRSPRSYSTVSGWTRIPEGEKEWWGRLK